MTEEPKINIQRKKSKRNRQFNETGSVEIKKIFMLILNPN